MIYKICKLSCSLLLLFCSAAFAWELPVTDSAAHTKQPINAHGGGLLFFKGRYYWYGEIKSGQTIKVPHSNWENYRVDAEGVSCYSSTDLKQWRFEGKALQANTSDPDHDLHTSKVIERPKVIYNRKTKKFVMWMHIDTQNYGYSRAGVAVSDIPTGPFTYIKSVRPNGNMARDMTIFVDDDGKAYHFYSSEENATMHIARLSEDYLSHMPGEKRILTGQYREAPAVVKHGKKYYLFTSGCTGWSPNAAAYAVADSMMGEWTAHGNPCKGPGAEQTFSSQSTYVLPVPGNAGEFIFMADKWEKLNLAGSDHLWLRLRFDDSGAPVITNDLPWKPKLYQ